MAEDLEQRLAVLRAELERAEHAAADVAEDADVTVKAAAKKAVAEAEQALSKAHLEAKAAAEKVEVEVRKEEPVVKAEVKSAEAEVAKVVEAVKRDLGLQESNQSASTQNVRGTEDLTPEEHAKRLNPNP